MEQLIGKKSLADRFQQQVDKLASAGSGCIESSWGEFRQEYEENFLLDWQAGPVMPIATPWDSYQTYEGSVNYYSDNRRVYC